MKIPAHINQLKFYQEAAKKNIQIESRYAGVYLFLSWNKAPRWKAECSKNGHPVVIGTYPLTEVGEKAAANAYLAYSRINSTDAIANTNKPNQPEATTNIKAVASSKK